MGLASNSAVSETPPIPEPKAPDCVALKTLSLSNLRNYAALQVSFDGQLVVLTGANGAGKTNLLEAISLLTPGRGLRRAAFDDIVRTGASDGWTVAATVNRADEDTKLGTGLAATPSGERSRKVRINGAPASSADALLDYLRVLWLTPAMDGIFVGPASDRRRLVDRFVLTIDPGHARRTRDFERLLTQRNRLLEEGGATSWLDAVEAELAAHAVAVALARAETVALLSARMERQSAEVPVFPVGRIALVGDFDEAVSGVSAAEAEAGYRRSLAEARPIDRAAGRTLNGPHRSDLEVVLAAKDMPAARSSTGEQKALLIGLVLAHAELVAALSGMTPVLLLDEVAAHLDPGRRIALFDRLGALGSQAFMTGADPLLFEALEGAADMFQVAENSLRHVGEAAGP